ncbi:MAG: sugar phosphate nucleotidyltransferase [archaeon]|nr:sugar phosphate nucleotidyltransferase [archaeon]
MKEKISVTVDSSVLRAVEGIVDGIRIKNRSDAIEYLLKRSVGDKRVAVILCGGDEKKQLLSDGLFRFVAKIGESTVVEDTVLQLKSFGFSRIFVVGQNNVLVQIFSVLKNGESFGVSVDYVEESEPRGTAHSLSLVASKVDCDFLVVYGDLVFRYDLNRLFREHVVNGGVVTLALSSAAHPAEKGTVQLDGNRVLSFSQKVRAASSFIAFTPIFVASADVFSVDGDSLEDEVFPELARKGRLYGLVLPGREVHVHKKGDLVRAREMIRA